MKKSFLFIIICIALLKFTFATELPKAKVYIYRQSNFYASGINYKVFADDTLIVRLKNNSYVVYDCFPGNYKFSIDKKTDSRLNLNIESGKTYFINLNVNIGFWAAMPQLTLVQDSAFAMAQINKSKQISLENNLYSYIRPKYRVGLNLGFGGGFKKTAVYSINNGGYSYISTGGGFAIGGKFGYELSKKIDLALDFNYQFSFLIPHLNNAENTYKRANISLTPSYILAIRDGERMRFKFGAGLDYYFDNMLIIEGKNIPKDGFNDTWKYENATGWHASVNYELNISDNLSLNYGLKYYAVKYKFKSSYLMIPNDESALKNPDGSGIDFLISFNYHFK